MCLPKKCYLSLSNFSLKFLTIARCLKLSLMLSAIFATVSPPILAQYSNLKYLRCYCSAQKLSIPPNEMLCWNSKGLPPSSSPWSLTANAYFKMLNIPSVSLVFLIKEMNLIFDRGCLTLSFLIIFSRSLLSSFAIPERFKWVIFGQA